MSDLTRRTIFNRIALALPASWLPLAAFMRSEDPVKHDWEEHWEKLKSPESRWKLTFKTKRTVFLVVHDKRGFDWVHWVPAGGTGVFMHERRSNVEVHYRWPK